MNLRRWHALFAGVVLVSCGGQRTGFDGAPDGGVDNLTPECTLDTDCDLGQQCRSGKCTEPVIDAGTQHVCLTDADCRHGLQCLKSTGECVEPPATDGGFIEGPGVPACQPGAMISCGQSKLGECKLGTSTCSETAGVWGMGPCIGAINPGFEVCDGKDNDCDGIADEGLPDLMCGVGECAVIQASCVAGAARACVPAAPTAEICDGKDNDCNGMIDDGIPMLTCGVGACARSTVACMAGTAQVCTPGASSPELCDGLDNNCDGAIDEGLGNKTCGIGACLRTVAACVNGASNSCMPGAPGVETCNGIDDDCDGVIDNGMCGPTTTCPANQSVNPNTTVALSATAVSPAGRPLTCAWSVVSRPATSSGTFTNGTSCTGGTSYFADVVGTHVVRFTTTDSLGLQAHCDVTLTVNALGDLWVELTWNVANDMDLHMIHPSAGGSHVAGSWTGTYDAYFANRTPSWDVAGITDDPSLDRDDISGTGPENTRINVPSTSHSYTIGVHMYSWVASPTPVVATVKVYCGGLLKQTLTRSVSTNKQMWVVGSVSFSSATACTFTPDGFTLNVP
jgi:hypothetical protein